LPTAECAALSRNIRTAPGCVNGAKDHRLKSEPRPNPTPGRQCLISGRIPPSPRECHANMWHSRIPPTRVENRSWLARPPRRRARISSSGRPPYDPHGFATRPPLAARLDLPGTGAPEVPASAPALWDANLNVSAQPSVRVAQLVPQRPALASGAHGHSGACLCHLVAS
jgi:hypothetical protein